MKTEYIVIPRSVMNEQVKHLVSINNIREANELQFILSESKPLEPIVADAFEAGHERGYYVAANNELEESLRVTELIQGKTEYLNNLTI